MKLTEIEPLLRGCNAPQLQVSNPDNNIRCNNNSNIVTPLCHNLAVLTSEVSPEIIIFHHPLRQLHLHFRWCQTATFQLLRHILKATRRQILMMQSAWTLRRVCEIPAASKRHGGNCKDTETARTRVARHPKSLWNVAWCYWYERFMALIQFTVYVRSFCSFVLSNTSKIHIKSLIMFQVWANGILPYPNGPKSSWSRSGGIRSLPNDSRKSWTWNKSLNQKTLGMKATSFLYIQFYNLNKLILPSFFLQTNLLRLQF